MASRREKLGEKDFQRSAQASQKLARPNDPRNPVPGGNNWVGGYGEPVSVFPPGLDRQSEYQEEKADETLPKPIEIHSKHSRKQHLTVLNPPPGSQTIPPEPPVHCLYGANAWRWHSRGDVPSRPHRVPDSLQ